MSSRKNLSAFLKMFEGVKLPEKYENLFKRMEEIEEEQEELFKSFKKDENQETMKAYIKLENEWIKESQKITKEILGFDL